MQHHTARFSPFFGAILPPMRIRNRIEQLEKTLPPPPPSADIDDRLVKRCGAIFKRLFRLVKTASELMTEDEIIQVAEAWQQCLYHRTGPLQKWFGDLLNGKCRLPEITPQAMKDLLLAWLSPECDSFACLCLQCGMEYPHARLSLAYKGPPFFTSCPGCGASCNDMEWVHLASGHRPWMELDGYIGRRR